VRRTPIGEILEAAGTEGIVLESGDRGDDALLPVDHDLIDLLIERSPDFRAHCRAIREHMDPGQFQTQQEVKRRLAGE
jgi:hypothetical protein